MEKDNISQPPRLACRSGLAGRGLGLCLVGGAGRGAAGGAGRQCRRAAAGRRGSGILGPAPASRTAGSLAACRRIRFLTDLDYPPFDYAGPDGNPAGFNVDLARLICNEIKVACTIQARPFVTLLDALNDNRGDAVIASIAATAETRKRADFSDPYYRTPARFVARADSPIGDVLPELVAGKKIAVIAGTAHEAYLKQMFTQAEIHSYPNAEAARAALKDKQVDLLFGDGIALSFWLNGTDSGGCCAFRGGPFLDSRFFGDGIGIAVKPGNDVLREAFNWALFRIWEKGSFTDLWLRYFPISPF